ncbi:MAG: DegT/DnrJ/EryC1/StrS family aminotransferase [Nanoarchaeota archaeon]
MIKLIKSTFYKEEETKKKLCNFIMNSSQLSMSNKCLEFEKDFSEYQGRKYSVLFNSGSSANLALIQALVNLKILSKGDSVGFSALTWATNVMPLMQLGLKPIPIDVSLENLNVNSKNLLETLENNNIKSLFITNLLGFCGDLGKIAEICKSKNILLLEDNCESLGSELNNTKLGNFGFASTFSFFIGHHMPTIEGGMVCTDDKVLYNALLMTRTHGWSRNLNDQERSILREVNNIDAFYDMYTFYVQGYNLRPTEITGLLGLEQLKYLEEMKKLRFQNFKKFHEINQRNNDFILLDFEHMNFVSNFAYPIQCINKDQFLRYKKKFTEKDIEIRPIVGGSMVEQPFFKIYLYENGLNFSCPNAKMIHEMGFYIPNNPELTLEEINLICETLKNEN